MNEELNTPEHRSDFSGAQLSQELEHQAEIGKLSGDLLRDFYQTFRLSQKETAIQPPLFSLLADQHVQAGHQDILPTALNAADNKVDELLPPRRHGDTDEESRNNSETGFRAMWAEYSKVLQVPDSGIRRTPELILEDMLAQDLYYQENDRPNRGGQDDVHESIVREYILGNRLTGSDQLMAVRNQLREALVSPSVDDDSGGDWMLRRRAELIEEWEANHSSQSFMSQDRQDPSLKGF
ncbi:MAG TPA: hypothetical protein VMT30_05000 [Candidatus Saccharimonadia bacterium]|nr:hypothetical protein [Candidatus Saccharimonadia bacterium]